MTYASAFEPRTQSGLQAISSQTREWNGITVDATEIYWAGKLGWHDITPDQPTLLVALEEVGGRYEHRTRLDEPPRSSHLGARSISLVPAGMRLWGFANNLRYVRNVRLTFDLAAMNTALGEKLSPPTFDKPHLMFSDDRLWQICALLAAECGKPEGCDQLYGDSLTVALCVDLQRLREPPERNAARGGLTPRQLRRLTEYMEARLSDTVQLKDLAELTGLSLSYFGRAFRASTGMPPHQWHLNARLRRAQELLLDSTLPLAEVALCTGFADQSHFTRSFHRQVGSSPGAWRRERRN